MHMYHFKLTSGQSVTYRSRSDFGADPDSIIKALRKRFPEHDIELIDAIPTPAITPEDIKSERQRRINAFIPIDKQLANLRQLTELLIKGKENWSPSDTLSVEAIQRNNAGIDALVSTATELESSDALPADFTDDSYWPSVGKGEHKPQERLKGESLPSKRQFELALIESGFYDVDSIIVNLSKGLSPRDGAVELLAYRSMHYDEKLRRNSELFSRDSLRSAAITDSYFNTIWSAAIEMKGH